MIPPTLPSPRSTQPMAKEAHSLASMILPETMSYSTALQMMGSSIFVWSGKHIPSALSPVALAEDAFIQADESMDVADNPFSSA